MIAKFSFQNLLSISDKQTFSFELSKTDRMDPKYYVTMPDGTRILKIACIFGANASGKSNLLSSLRPMISFITNSFKTLEPGENIGFDVFKFSKDNEFKDVIDFEIEFYVSGKRYIYSISLNDTEVLMESLYYIPTSQKKMLYSREHGEVKWGPDVKGVKKQLQESTRPNTTILNVAAQFNNEVLSPICYELRNCCENCSSDEMGYGVLRTISKHPWVKECVVELFKASGIREVQDLVINSKPILEQVQKMYTPEIIEKFKSLGEDFTTYSAKMVHSVNDALYSIDLGAESTGTTNLLSKAIPLVYCLKNNMLLLIDEFEHSFHYDLLEFLISVFNNSSVEAQLLFTTQSIALLESPCLVNEQIWFAYKDDNAKSRYFRLSEKPGVRKDKNRLNLYRSEAFGIYPKSDKTFKLDVESVYQKYKEKEQTETV